MRAGLQAAIDTILTLDYHSEAVVLKFRGMCNSRVRDGMEIVHDLNELALSLPSGRQRTIISKARDGVISLDRALLDGMDNGLAHHGTCHSLFSLGFIPAVMHVYAPRPYDWPNVMTKLTFFFRILEECRRLRDWFREQLANAGDDSAYEQYDRGKAISGYKWNQHLK